MSETLQAKLNRLRTEMHRTEAALKAEEQRQAAMTVEQRVAEELHRIKCHYNHTDGCGWEYADHPTLWGVLQSPGTLEYSRQRYLEEAKRLLKSWSNETVMGDDNLVLMLRLIE